MLPEITSWEIILENILVILVGCSIYDIKEFEAMAVALEFTIIDKKFLFANVSNEKISLQHEMQNQW